MYNLLRSRALVQLAKSELPGLIAALVIAELFYKFGSFVFEALAFLVTWCVLSFAQSLVTPGELTRPSSSAGKRP